MLSSLWKWFVPLSVRSTSTLSRSYAKPSRRAPATCSRLNTCLPRIEVRDVCGNRHPCRAFLHGACNNRETTQAGFQACSNRCLIQSCQDTVIECRAGDQTVCNNGFRSCNNGCDALASIRLLPPSRIKRLAGAGAVHSSRSVSYSEPATCAPSPANRQSASICALSAPPLLLKSRGNGLKPNGLTLPST